MIRAARKQIMKKLNRKTNKKIKNQTLSWYTNILITLSYKICQ
jgi:hypothetical protein